MLRGDAGCRGGCFSRRKRRLEKVIRFSVTENGICVRKSLFSVVEVPFDEVALLRVASGDSLLRTRSGDEYVSRSVGVITHSYPELYDRIVEHNIEFTDDYEKTGVGKTFSHEEVRDLVSKVELIAQEVADRVISRKLGREYTAVLRVKEKNEDAIMYFSLAKNGEVVKLPREFNNGLDDAEETAFDDMVLFFLVEWHAETKSGRYGVTVELLDEAQCRATVEDFVDYFCETFIAAK